MDTSPAPSRGTKVSIIKCNDNIPNLVVYNVDDDVEILQSHDTVIQNNDPSSFNRVNSLS